ncbi:MAG: DUF72 domain-containing protein [Planctomycetota bacterium]
MTAKAIIGTSGFSYDDWTGPFYPPDVKKREWLEYYAEHFDTVEINWSYYHMPRATVCESWRRRTPDRFLDVCPARLRWAVEFRDPSWLRDEVYEVLRAHDAALVVHDLIEDHPRIVTADWAYLRFHGTAARKYHGEYGEALLGPVAERIRTHLGEGRDVYAYFNNDYECHAVFDARTLKRLVTGAEEP